MSIELAYSEVGDGPPLVLIMGLNADRDAWQPHVEQWRRRFRCILVDNRGAGASPAPPGPYTTVELAEDYAALIARLGLGRSRVVGISMGGAIAQQLALRHADLVDRLVLVATWARPHPYPAAVFETIASYRALAGDADFARYLQTLVWTPSWFAGHAAELSAGLDTSPVMPAVGISAQVAACVGHDVLASLPQITAPTLVTAGRVDRFVPVELSEEIAAAVPGARLELFDTGHVHHWEELDRFNDCVEDFLT